MQTIRAAFVLARKDLISWFRTPMHVLLSFAPIVIIMLVLRLAFGGGETMPVAVVMESPEDPLSLQFVEVVKDIGTTNAPWFEVTTTDSAAAEALLQKNTLLGIIEVPDITETLESGRDATVHLRVLNLNQDITKNFRQRVQEACLVFGDRMQISSVVAVAPSIRADVHTALPADLPSVVFLGAGLIAMAIAMGGINNAATLVAREFEENTYKDLVLAPGTLSIVLGKWTSGLVQTFVTVGFISALAVPICHFSPQGSLWPLLLLVVVGSLSFSGLGTILGLCFRQVIPAAITGMLIAIVGWWFGGIIWADIWPAAVQPLVKILPTTYLIRPFTYAALLDVYTTYWADIAVLLSFGIATAAVSYVLLRRRIAL